MKSVREICELYHSGLISVRELHEMLKNSNPIEVAKANLIPKLGQYYR